MDELDELGNPSVSNEILENLNDSQKEAVSAPLSNMLVIAGAGTGKTSSMRALLNQLKVDSGDIMFVNASDIWEIHIAGSEIERAIVYTSIHGEYKLMYIAAYSPSM